MLFQIQGEIICNTRNTIPLPKLLYLQNAHNKNKLDTLFWFHPL